MHPDIFDIFSPLLSNSRTAGSPVPLPLSANQSKLSAQCSRLQLSSQAKGSSDRWRATTVKLDASFGR
jgi:hypothetical protein